MRFKVLLITWACDLEDVSEPEISGRWVQQMSLDHEVTLFSVSRPDRYGCVSEQFPDLEIIEWSDVKVPESLERFRAIVKPGYIAYYLKARRFLKKLLAERSFDIIHHLSPFSWRYPSPAAGLGVPLIRGPLAGGLRTPIGLMDSQQSSVSFLSLLRKTDNLRIRFDPILRKSIKKTDHVLFAAPYVEELLSALPIQSKSIEIEHGITEGQECMTQMAKQGEDSKIALLFVGRTIPTKGLYYAIKAMGMAQSRERLGLTVVGDGEDLARCKTEASNQGLAEQVSFTGWLSKDHVNNKYWEADIFLFPSYREPTGGVILEAMTHGLPVICCAYGGPDYFIDSDSGIKVSPNSEQDFIKGLSAAIDTLAFDLELRKRLSIGARSRSKEVFSWEIKRQRVRSLYAKVRDLSGR